MTRRLLIFSCVVFAASAQTFEVATVKPSPQRMVWSGFQATTPGQFEASHVSLKAMVAYAYRTPQFNVDGGPAWTATTLFDIQAKVDPSASTDQLRIMMQGLLKERFGVTLRRASKTVTIQNLELTDAPKLKVAATPDSYIKFLERGKIEGHASRMVDVSRYLQDTLNQNVVDKTGLSGAYDFVLNYASDEMQSAGDPRPSLFTALREQLGLKLVASKGSVDSIVIDQASQPSDN